MGTAQATNARLGKRQTGEAKVGTRTKLGTKARKLGKPSRVNPRKHKQQPYNTKTQATGGTGAKRAGVLRNHRAGTAATKQGGAEANPVANAVGRPRERKTRRARKGGQGPTLLNPNSPRIHLTKPEAGTTTTQTTRSQRKPKATGCPRATPKRPGRGRDPPEPTPRGRKKPEAKAQAKPRHGRPPGPPKPA